MHWAEVIHFGYNRNQLPPVYAAATTLQTTVWDIGVKIVESNPEVTFDFEGTPLVFRHYSSVQQTTGTPGIDVFLGSFTSRFKDCFIRVRKLIYLGKDKVVSFR